MRTIVIKECEIITNPNVSTLDLTQIVVNNCTGCWSCWWKTPGRCTQKDLDEFYHQYITTGDH